MSLNERAEEIIGNLDSHYCKHKDCPYYLLPSQCTLEHCKEHLYNAHLELFERIKIRDYVLLVARDSRGRIIVAKKE